MTSVFNSSLGTTITADGNGAAVAVPKGGTYGIIVRGTGLGGGTLTIQVSDDGTNWVDTSVAPAINSYNTIVLGAKYVRYSLADATTPSISAITMALAS